MDKVVEDVQASPRAKSLWNNIVEQCDFQVTKECQSLCFENIVILYASVWFPVCERFPVCKRYCKQVQVM